MREARLLERIRHWEKEPHRRSREDPGRVIDSVMNYLQRILNTRRGNAPIAEDFGIPDFTEFLSSYPDSLREFERTIRETILKFEPRLKAVRVSFIPQEEDPFAIHFQIAARLTAEHGNQPVQFVSLMDHEGRIRINR